jgi:hypothetical protein
MSTETNLKAKNASMLWAFFLFNAVVFLSVFFASNVDAILHDFKTMLSFRASGILIAPLVLFLINGILSSEQKAVLVFWRIKNVLPGSRAFSKHGKSDPRVNMQRLNTLHGPLPSAANDQNSLWFKLYRSNSSEASVIKSHKDFLLARDMVSITFLYIIFTAIPMLFIGDAPYTYYYLGALLLEYVFIVRVAQNHGKRFVTNVLALESVK